MPKCRTTPKTATGLFYLLMFLIVTDARGAFVFNVIQSGTNVITSGTGTLDTEALQSEGIGNSSFAQVDPLIGLLIGGPTFGTPTPAGVYQGISGPQEFGASPHDGAYSATIGNGAEVGLAYGVALYVPIGYVSGSYLSDTDTYSGVTLGYLGFASGTYVYTWGSGPTADSLTINIGTVPEPASLVMLGVPAAIALLRRRRGIVAGAGKG